MISTDMLWYMVAALATLGGGLLILVLYDIWRNH